MHPLRVQIVHRLKLSHGTHDAHIPSALFLLPPVSNNPPTLSPPSRPHPALGKRTISAPLQAEVKQQHCCGGSCDVLSNMSHVWVLLRCYSTYIIKSTLLSFAALPEEGSVCF